MNDLFDPPPSERSSTTSVAAAAAKTPLSAGQQRRNVMRVLVIFGALTREQIAEELGLSGDSVRPRVWELMRHDPPLVRENGERPTVSGRMAAVLEPTFAGRVWLAESQTRESP